MVQFGLCLTIGPGNDERQRAFELYQKAFHITEYSTSTPPDCDILHILMKIHGVSVLIAPGNPQVCGFNTPVSCEVRYADRQEFDHAYNTLLEGCRSSSIEGPYPWAECLGLITDAFGIGWALYYNA